ncbi:MAG TPA: DUF6089 family protein [Ferruginibacter sp.]|nr:DUF6089 family protein [Ferruginibacter sp.]
MKVIVPAFLLLMPFYCFSQRLHADLYAGVANYQGDLQGKRFTFAGAKPGMGLGLSYDITNKFIIRGAASYLTIAGDDKNNSSGKGIEFRNLNFKTHILEAQLAMEFNFFDLAERSFTPFVFAGIAAFHFQPYTFDNTGKKVFLRPLSTEGQGLPQYPDVKPYNTKQFAIPFGGGVKLALSERLQVGIEIGFRKLFTDYLDDVSYNYVDSSILLAAKGPTAVAFAYRGGEVGGPGYPADQSQRGNIQFKDWYYFTGLKISYVFGGNGGGGGNGSSKRSKVGCPMRVY